MVLLSLYDMRITAGISGSSVSRICGITYRSLRNWETGAATPNIVSAYDLLQIYGYSFYALDLTPFYAQQKRAVVRSNTDLALRKQIIAGSPQKRLSLYDMRQAVGYTSTHITISCGITYRSLRNWETGTTVPNIVNIYDLLQLYGHSFYELDLAPFYETFEERSRKRREEDAQIDNPSRYRR